MRKVVFLGTIFDRCVIQPVSTVFPWPSSYAYVSSRLSVRCDALALSFLLSSFTAEESRAAMMTWCCSISLYNIIKNPVSKGNRRHVVEVVQFSIHKERGGGDSQQQSAQCLLAIQHRDWGWKSLPPAGYIWVTQVISFSGKYLVLWMWRTASWTVTNSCFFGMELEKKFAFSNCSITQAWQPAR